MKLMTMETDSTPSPAFFGRWLVSFIIVLCVFVPRAFAQTETPPAPPALPAPSVPAPPLPTVPPEPPVIEKRVVVDKTEQMLFAYEGERLVMQSRVSTGRMGWRTPSGEFTAGDKERMHYSRLFHNAPMPWSVQVHGHFFIHGFSYVPDYPASHGCIRLPASGDNPAKRFYEWVERDTPVTITGDWAGKPRAVKQPKKK